MVDDCMITKSGEALEIIPVSEKFEPIKFLATSDPQYDARHMSPDGGATLFADSISVLLDSLIKKEGYRGVLIAGDCSHESYTEEIDGYMRFVNPFLLQTYEGLGNHDFRKHDSIIDVRANLDFGLKEIVGYRHDGWDVSSLRVWEHVRSHPRETMINDSYPNLHYSWDWGGVHFVQLNLFPGNDPVHPNSLQDPLKSLDFLKADLAEHVGESNKPVILCHHYGFDSYSRTLLEDSTVSAHPAWWREDQRADYWDALEPYNVIAIYSGHQHLCEGCDGCFLPWDGLNVGRKAVDDKYINSFVCGAARDGLYTTNTIYDNALVVEKYLYKELVYRWVVPIER